MTPIQEIQENNELVLQLLTEEGVLNTKYIKQLIQANQYLLSITSYDETHYKDQNSTRTIEKKDETDWVKMEEGYNTLAKPKLKRCVRTVHTIPSHTKIGISYTVEQSRQVSNSYNCNCPAFQFNNTEDCKHIKQVKNYMSSHKT